MNILVEVAAPAIGTGTVAILCAASFEGTWNAKSAIAQIGLSPNGTNTEIVDSNPDDGISQIDINGGVTSVNGKNLFHGFDQFNVEADQLVNFNADRKVENIFSYITGGTSTINGILQVSSLEETNLYLINPSGILFGPDVQLQLPGNLTATTASVIGFGNRYQLDLTDSNLSSTSYYRQLKGTPTYFDFAGAGSVVTLGELTAPEDQQISLIGGQTLSNDAEALSNIALTVVEEGTRVRLSQLGQVLSLEFTDIEDTIDPLSLSELLTGSGLVNANELDVDADGTVRLVEERTSTNGTSTDSTRANNNQSTVGSNSLDEETNRLLNEGINVSAEDQSIENQPSIDQGDSRQNSSEQSSQQTASAATGLGLINTNEPVNSLQSGSMLIGEATTSNSTSSVLGEDVPMLFSQPEDALESLSELRYEQRYEQRNEINPKLSQPIVQLDDTAAFFPENALEEGNRSAPSTILSATKIDSAPATELLKQVETESSRQFANYLNLNEEAATKNVASLSEIQDTLSSIRRASPSVRPALVYAYFVPDAAGTDSSGLSSPSDPLEVMAINSEGMPVRHRHQNVTRADVVQVSARFRREVTSQFSRPADYLPPAQQLYQWLIQPLESHLNEEEVNSLGLIMDEGLRVLPLAALHDGNQFLVEKYSVGLIPTFSLTSFGTDEKVSTGQVLAMGASEFSNQPPLPAVEAELSYISDSLWLGDAFINESFTLQNLRAKVASQEYSIVHLATHAIFDERNAEGSYIQMWEQRLQLSDLQTLGLDASNVAMVILSACSTAIGDRASEYGFAGFALSAGSESAMASLWPVSDEGTLGFMTQFYNQLPQVMNRSEALRAAQLSLLSGSIGIDYGRVYGTDGQTLVNLPELSDSGTWDFAHPYYWSAFTMIGNPW